MITIRRKRRIAVTVGLLAALLALGIVGGMEWGIIPFWRGAVLTALCEAVWAASWWKAGWIKV